MWFVLYHLKSNNEIQVNGKSNNEPNVWLWSVIFPKRLQQKSRVLYYLLLSLAQQHTATHMLIACPKTAPVLWIDLGVGPLFCPAISFGKNVGPVTGIVIIYQLVVKKYEKIYWWLLFLTSNGDLGHQFLDPSLLNHKFPPKSQVLLVKFLHVQIHVPR